MNWTGGNLQRHSKNKSKALENKQRQHFAKVRSKLESGTLRRHRSHVPSPRRTSHVLPAHRHGLHNLPGMLPHAQDVIAVDAVNTDRNPGSSEVQINIGSRALASNLDTTVAAAPSTNLPWIRPDSESSGSMLFDEHQAHFYQEPHDTCGSFRAHSACSDDVSLNPPTSVAATDRSGESAEPTNEQRQTRVQTTELSELPTLPPCLYEQETRLSAGDGGEEVQGVPQLDNPRALFRLSHEAIDNQRLNDTDASKDRAACGWNESHGDYAWQNFVRNGTTIKSLVRRNVRCTASSSTSVDLAWAIQDPRHDWPISQKDSGHTPSLDFGPPPSLCPTSQACYTEIYSSEQMTRQLSNQDQDLDNESWKRFVLGLGATAR